MWRTQPSQQPQLGSFQTSTFAVGAARAARARPSGTTAANARRSASLLPTTTGRVSLPPIASFSRVILVPPGLPGGGRGRRPTTPGLTNRPAPQQCAVGTLSRATLRLAGAPRD